MNELTHLRTARSKTYDVGGGQRRTEITMHRQHYQDGAEWRDIETDWLYEDGFGHKIQKSDYRVRRHGNKMRFGFAPGVYVDYTVPVELSFDGNTAIGQLDGNAAIKYVGTPDGLKMDIVLSACPVLAPSYGFAVDSVNCSASADGNALLFRDASGEVVGAIPAPYMVDANGNEGAVTLDYVNGNIVLTPDWEWLQSAQYPVVIDPTTTLQVSAGADDGHQSSTFNATNTTMQMGITTSVYSLFARFTNVNVPQGSTVTAAHIEMRAGNTRSGSALVRIFANADDNATAPANNTQYLGKATTSAYVDWAPEAFTINTWYNSPDIKDVVQEVIDRPGWVSGNAMLLLVKDNGSTSSVRIIYTYEQTGNISGPKLVITYSDGSGGTDGTVTAVTATASASAVAPTVTGQRNATVSAVCATATAESHAPSVAGSVVVNATVNAVCAAASAAAPAPTVAGETSGVNGSVAAVAATASAAFVAPTVVAQRNATVAAACAEAVAAFTAPNIIAVRNAAVEAATATATAQMPSPHYSTRDAMYFCIKYC